MPRKKKDGDSRPEQEQEQDQEHRDEEDEEEYASATPRISFTDLEKSMTSFSGDDAYGIETWITEFEDIASLMEWSDLEKLIYSKRLLSGTARLFLRSLRGITRWSVLKTALREEFCSTLNSAALHKRLASRKMKTNETYQQYFLHMKEIALLGSIEDEALMEYVIDGIRDTELNKSILYGASNMKAFRKKLELYSEIRKKIDTKTHNSTTPSPSPSTSKEYQPKPKIRCYNCGSTDHFSKDCTKGVKCFKCNNFGHKSTECQSNEKQQLTIQVKDKDCSVAPYKDVHINNVSMKALIDTGSDVNLIKESYVDKIKHKNYNKDSVLCLKGIADYKIQTKGSFLASIQIDDCYFDTTISVVDDDAIPVNVILGNPILNDVEIRFTLEGISARRHLTTLQDFKEDVFDIARIGCEDEIKTMIKDFNPANPQNESIAESDCPIHQNSRRLSPLVLDVVNTQNPGRINAGIGTSSKSDFANPVILIKNKNGLYPQTAKERYPLMLEENYGKIERRPGTKMKRKYDYKAECRPGKMKKVNVLTDIASQKRAYEEDDLKIKLENKLLETEPYEDYVIENGILCKVKDGNKLFMVPKKMQTEVMRKNDEKRHFSIIKTEEPVLREYYADQMKPWLVAEDCMHSSETDE